MKLFLIGLCVLLSFTANITVAESVVDGSGKFCDVFHSVYVDEKSSGLSPLLFKGQRLVICNLDDMYTHLKSKNVDISQFNALRDQVLGCIGVDECTELANQLTDSIVAHVEGIKSKSE